MHEPTILTHLTEEAVEQAQKQALKQAEQQDPVSQYRLVSATMPVWLVLTGMAMHLFLNRETDASTLSEVVGIIICCSTLSLLILDVIQMHKHKRQIVNAALSKAD